MRCRGGRASPTLIVVALAATDAAAATAAVAALMTMKLFVYFP